jgi:hypothetical protein
MGSDLSVRGKQQGLSSPVVTEMKFPSAGRGPNKPFCRHPQDCKLPKSHKCSALTDINSSK